MGKDVSFDRDKAGLVITRFAKRVIKPGKKKEDSPNLSLGCEVMHIISDDEEEKIDVTKRLSWEAIVMCVLFSIRSRRLLKRRVVFGKWDELIDGSLVITPSNKFVLIRDMERFRGKIKRCESCARRYEIFRRGTFMDLRRNSHWIPFAWILRRRRAAKRIERWLMKFKVSKTKFFEYQRLLSSESIAMLISDDDEED